MKHLSARRRGFTLVELLVSISILAMVAVLGWRGLDGIVRARATLSVQMEQTRGMQLAFAQMQSDCEHLAGVGAASNQLHGRRNLLAENGRLTLVRTVFGENEAAQLQVVSYRISDGVLQRRESVGTRDLLQLDAIWKAALENTDTSTPVVLQSDVAGMASRIYANGSWLGADAGAPAKAAGLEVSLQLKGQEISLIKVFLLGAT